MTPESIVKNEMIMTQIQFSLIKKKKIGPAEHLLPWAPPKSDNISFLPYPSQPPQSGRQMCITL